METDARCRLADFLDEPEPPPPTDWVAAVVHDAGRGHAVTDAVERAELARTQAEEAEQRIASLNGGAGMDQQTIDRATGHLVAVFGVTSGRAFECLAWVAQESNVGLSTAAERFVSAVDDLGRRGHDREELLALLGRLEAGRDDSAT